MEWLDRDLNSPGWVLHEKVPELRVNLFGILFRDYPTAEHGRRSWEHLVGGTLDGPGFHGENGNGRPPPKLLPWMKVLVYGQANPVEDAEVPAQQFVVKRHGP